MSTCTSTQTPFYVLLVEDNPADVFYVKEINAQSGGKFFIHSVTTLTEAEKYILTNGMCDVVLLDLNLEETSGIDTFHEFITKFPYLPIVVLTGIMNQELVQQCLEEGAQDFIVKGEITPDEFLKSVRYSIMRNVKRGGGVIASTPRMKKTKELLGDVKTWLDACSHV